MTKAFLWRQKFDVIGFYSWMRSPWTNYCKYRLRYRLKGLKSRTNVIKWRWYKYFATENAESQNLKMSEVKRRARVKYLEQELWNNISKENSFQDRLLELKRHKFNRDENVAVRAWDSEQLLMMRRNKKLRELINSAEACKRGDHNASRCHSHLTSSHHLPTLPHRDRPLTTGQTIYLGLPTGLSLDRRCRSHSDLTAETKQEIHGNLYLPAVSCAERSRRSSHLACSRNTSLSDSEIPRQRIRETTWASPSIQLHKRDDVGLWIAARK